ncbi:MAG: DUF2298 domain-containing protein [Euryarchaeota archaeon]|nr:DUF2298 domain-containing protein [Euryarchaeota archaeon]
MLTEVIIWYAMISFIGAAAFPIVSMVCKNLSDHGYGISKIVGILMLAYLTWILSYPLSFKRDVVLLSLAIICIVSLLCIKSRPQIKSQIKWEVIIRNEVLFVIGFIIFLMIRAYNPEITTFGEKFMDFAFLNAVMRSSHFPPHDPWFAGGLLNFYYYFGYLIVAVLSKLSDIPTTITYNLGLVTFSALAANISFGIGYDLTKKMRYGVSTMIFVVFIANPYIVFNMAGSLLHLPVANHAQLFGFWASTRVIPNTINEFPYFSFIFGDLHPHVVSIPFQLLVLALLLNIYKSNNKGMNIYGENRIHVLAGIIISALSIGVLFPMNAWDYPTYLVLFIIIVSVQQYRAACIRNALIPIISVLILSILLFTPFYLDFYGAGASGIGIAHQKTLLINFIEIFALFLFLIFSSLFSHSDLDRRYVIALIPLAILSLLFFQILIIIIPLIILCIYLFNNNTKNNQFVLALVLVGSLLAVFCEVFYLNDRLGAPNERMNTVFKLYLQIWILWGVAAGYCLYDLSLKHLSSRKRTIWTVLFCILIASCCIYPFTATYTKMNIDHNPASLDGIAYLNRSDRGDYFAISWIRRNITGTPVIIEAPGRCYSTDSRVSAFTGLPTVIGWRGHEMMWRGSYDDIRVRAEDVDKIYSTEHIDTIIDLLNKYNVTYVYIGATERARYRKGLDKFEDEDYFECIYIGSVRIYKCKLFTKV